jgi:cation diffusion facilitator family transporter
VEKRIKLVQKASIIALVGNALLASLKLAIGFLSGSLAVVSDGVDSATDVAIAVMNLVAARIAAQPGDREHPYGHTRAETIATAALAFIVFFAGAQLFIGAAGSLLKGEAATMPGIAALVVTAVSIIGKLLLAWSQFAYGKRSGSALLLANGTNMRGDVVTSAAVLLGLGLGYLLGVPILDRILALLVSLWIIRNAIGIFMEANEELMDGSTDHGPYAEVFTAVSSVPEAGNPHRTRIRRLGGLLVVDMDIEVEPGKTVREAHEVAVRVEKAIKCRLPEVYDVIVHVEPRGNLEEDERFGLRPEVRP